MKFIFYLLFIILFSSCFLLKNKNSYKVSKFSNRLAIDTTIDNELYEKVDMPLAKLINKSSPDRSISFDPPLAEPSVSKPLTDVIKTSKSKSIINNQIEDRTTKNQLDNPSLGVIAYSIPKEMKVGSTYTIKLRISKEKNKIQLLNGDGIPINNINVDSRIIISSLRVEPIMSAKLITDSSKMRIQSISTETQDIEVNGFTEWAWRLTPLKGGNVLLRIVVNIKQSVDGKAILKDIPVYDEVIPIKSNIIFSLSRFISQYWQWIITTIVIPLVVWFYNKNKKSKIN